MVGNPDQDGYYWLTYDNAPGYVLAEFSMGTWDLDTPTDPNWKLVEAVEDPDGIKALCLASYNQGVAAGMTTATNQSSAQQAQLTTSSVLAMDSGRVSGRLEGWTEALSWLVARDGWGSLADGMNNEINRRKALSSPVTPPA